MRDKYLTISSNARGEVTVKRSRFIADLSYAASETEALNFIEQIKKDHPDARHHCFAFITDAESASGAPVIVRASDDGEPSQTAGLPMLKVIQGAGLRNVCAVVTRYFGGTLLGTGGLARAYSDAVKNAIANAHIIERIPAVFCALTVDYSYAGKLPSIFAEAGVVTLDENYSDRVCYTFLAPEASVASLSAQITEFTSGKYRVEAGDEAWFSLSSART